MRKEAKAVENRREKHWSPDTLTSVDPTAWLLNITLARTMVRCLPGPRTDCRHRSEELQFLAVFPRGRKILEAKRL